MLEIIVDKSTGKAEMRVESEKREFFCESMIAMNMIAAGLKENFGVQYDNIYAAAEETQAIHDKIHQ